ncbi:hypothetical protein TPHA_0P00800 [Tetrapisispora phaffii CBS 4417]|uniref:Uncharacterized protein n=1 Tax=Tetrapisispora phaffii (strain ATCC 24235 / CBS 4417 / NBRC 1672 / NRRL Y-8282 / UCD 70-5) TaxID=1071381 RepID=G8C260_TETPH|nr:hypothetical protein TPHA_0P00800 [Tetrapisispora phaffii CBS 4417]CCE66238.1 hypothetical protein TPHA_0P00800 [Tetrapisispora phaffii CBS 4417]
MSDADEISFIVSTASKDENHNSINLVYFEYKDKKLHWHPGKYILGDTLNAHDRLGEIQKFCYVKPGSHISGETRNDGNLGDDISDYLFIAKKNGVIEVIKDFKKKVTESKDLIADFKMTCNLLPYFRDAEKPNAFDIISLEYFNGILYCSTRVGKVYSFFLNLPNYYRQVNNFFNSKAQDDGIYSIFKESYTPDNFENPNIFEKLTMYVTNEGWQDICYFLKPTIDTLKDGCGYTKDALYFRASFCVDIKRNIESCHVNPLDRYSLLISSNNINMSIEKFNIPQYFYYWLFSFLSKKTNTQNKLKSYQDGKQSESKINSKCVLKPPSTRIDRLKKMSDYLTESYERGDDGHFNQYNRNAELVEPSDYTSPQFNPITHEEQLFEPEVLAAFNNRRMLDHDLVLSNNNVAIIPSYICWEFKNGKEKTFNTVSFLERRSLRRRNREMFNEILNHGGNWVPNIDDSISTHSNSLSNTSTTSLDKRHSSKNPFLLLDFYACYNSNSATNNISEIDFLTPNYSKLKLISISRNNSIEVFKPKYQNIPSLKIDSFKYVEDEKETLETFNMKCFKDKMTISSLTSFQKLFKINENLSLIIDEAGLLIIDTENITNIDNLSDNNDKILKIALFNFGKIKDVIIYINQFNECMYEYPLKHNFEDEHDYCNDFSISLTAIVTTDADHILGLNGVFICHSKLGKLELTDSIITKNNHKTVELLQFLDFSTVQNTKKHYLKIQSDSDLAYKKQR